MSPQEIEAAVAKIRDRVQERYRKTVEDLDGFTLPPLDPLGHARDAAEGKAAAIGRVNPRRGGPVNNAIQYAKRLVARCLNWFVRDQIDYNRAVVVYMERVIETLIEQNYNLLRVARGVVDAQRSAAELNEGQQDIRRELNEGQQDIRRELTELNETQRDMLKHWRNWRPEWEKRLTDNEIKFLHMVREIEGAARQREEAAQAAAAKMRQELTDNEIKFLHVLREIEDAARQREEAAQAAAKMRQELTDNEIKFLHMLREIEDAARRHEETAQAAAAKMHQEYSALLAQSTDALQKQFWADMERQRTEQEKSSEETAQAAAAKMRQELTDNEIKFLHMLREIEDAARQREETAQAAAAKMHQELTDNEIKFLHMLREIEDAARRHEETAQAAAAKMHREYSALLAQSTDALQKQFWADMARQRTEQEKSSEETAQAAAAKMRQELTDNEIKFLHMLREIEDAARRHEETAQAAAAKMHQEYSALLAQSTGALQKQFWADMARQRTEQEKSIHTELRLIRQRSSRTATATAPPPPAPAADGTAAAILPFDYGRFQERFRGSEEYVAKSQSQYLEICRGLAPVADLGCGRGELLELFQAEGVECLGVDSDPDAAGACRDKGLNAEAGDLFEFLRRQEDGSLGAIVSAHVVEHLPPLRLPEIVELAAAKLKPAGILALETPNPACLAIFSGDFYLDPTHRRPAPAQQLRFYMEESGLGGVEVRELNPAYETIPELAGLREDPAAGPFVEKFFGGLDYVIWGKKL